MKMLTPKIALAVFLSFIGFQPLARAVNLSLVLNPSLTAAADPAYPGTGSTVTRATDAPTGFTFAVAGRSYGVDPGTGSARWGLRDGNLGSVPSRAGFIITNGFTPSATGSTTDRIGNGASYVSIAVASVQPGTVFQDVSIDFDGVVFTRATNAWAAASEGGFANFTAVRQSAGPTGRRLSVELPDFTFTGSEPLEFRVYGITGTDEGAISVIHLSATVNPSPVPEPSAGLLSLLGLAALQRRKRRA